MQNTSLYTYSVKPRRSLKKVLLSPFVSQSQTTVTATAPIAQTGHNNPYGNRYDLHYSEVWGGVFTAATRHLTEAEKKI